MIDPKTLTKDDIGKWVIYHSFNGNEIGRIKSYKGNLIYVVYHCGQNWGNFTNYTSAATHCKSLDFTEPPSDFSQNPVNDSHTTPPDDSANNPH